MSPLSISLRPRPTVEAPHLNCPTCRDEGLPAQVVAVNDATSMATALVDGVAREVALDLLNGVQVGDIILVHLDTAIARLDPADVMEA